MSNSNVVRTGAAGAVQTAQYIGKPVAQLPNTTLNEKLSIHATEMLTSDDITAVRYVCIGNGGHGLLVTGGRVKWKGLKHEPQHAALYNQLPFVLRTLDNDLTPLERQKYRLRRQETHGGVPYVAYYARVLDLSTTEVVRETRTVVDGVTTSKLFVPSIEDLNPVPPAITSGDAVTTTGSYLAVSAKVPFEMTKEEVEEFVKACAIIEGEDGFAIISEVTTVSGIDRSVSGTFGGAAQTYIEGICMQVTSFITTAFIMEYQTDGIKLNLDVGNVEPMSAGV